MSIFSERLSSLRKSKKLTQKGLAELLGVTVRIVQAYEYGEKKPEIDGFLRLAEIFGVSVDYLVGNSNSNKEVNTESVPSEQAELLRWIEENVGDVFFYEFDKSPENAKKQFMKDMKYMWERDKERGKDK